MPIEILYQVNVSQVTTIHSYPALTPLGLGADQTSIDWLQPVELANVKDMHLYSVSRAPLVSYFANVALMNQCQVSKARSSMASYRLPYFARGISSPLYTISPTYNDGRSEVVAPFCSKHSLARFGLEITTTVPDPIFNYLL